MKPEKKKKKGGKQEAKRKAKKEIKKWKKWLIRSKNCSQWRRKMVQIIIKETKRKYNKVINKANIRSNIRQEKIDINEITPWQCAKFKLISNPQMPEQ